VIPLLLLHGANGAALEIAPLSYGLRNFAPVFAPDLPGHGGRPVPHALDFSDLAADVIAQCDARGLGRFAAIGYSLGGTLALYLARHYPQRVCGVATLAAKVVFDQATVDLWTHLVGVDRLGKPGNPRQHELARLHYPQDWRAVARANHRLFLSLGAAPPLSEADLLAIAVPSLSLSGDKDQLVPRAETEWLADRLRGLGGFFPGQAHPLAAVPVASVVNTLGQWLPRLKGAPGEGQVAAAAGGQGLPRGRSADQAGG